MSENLKDYFYFSRSEKNGIIVLLAILISLIILPYLYSIIQLPENQIQQKFNEEVNLFASSVKKSSEPEYTNKLDQYIIERYDSLELFFFDPNNTSKENFYKLGLTEKQIATIHNYTSKGGKFRDKDDFRKIYGIREKQYQILKPYILLPEQNKIDYKNKLYAESQKTGIPAASDLFRFDPNTASDEDYKKLGLSEMNIKTIRNYQNKVGKFRTKEDFQKIYGITEEQYNNLEPYIFINQANDPIIPNQIIELNTAEIDELTKLKGIGIYSAEAIVKYRQKLGGFANINQLLEIKTISPENFELFKNNIVVDKTKIKTISLNFSEANELAAHPYLNYTQAKEIIKFRSINGSYQDKNQLLENKILLENNFRKIEPYLKVN